MKTVFAAALLASLSLSTNVIAAVQAQKAAPTAAAEAAPATAKLEIRGAKTSMSNEPLLIIAGGKTVRDPAISDLAAFLTTNTAFTIVDVQKGPKVARLVGKSTAAGTDFIEFDVALEMIPYAKLKVGQGLTAQIQKTGASTLIRLMVGTIPVGFMASETLLVP